MIGKHLEYDDDVVVVVVDFGDHARVLVVNWTANSIIKAPVPEFVIIIVKIRYVFFVKKISPVGIRNPLGCCLFCSCDIYQNDALAFPLSEKKSARNDALNQRMTSSSDREPYHLIDKSK
jgi:hypothetical protein